MPTEYYSKAEIDNHSTIYNDNVKNESSQWLADETQQLHMMSRATVKWPNDVLLHISQNLNERFMDILIKSAHE